MIQIFSGEIEICGGDIQEEVSPIIKALEQDLEKLNWVEIELFKSRIYQRIFKLLDSKKIEEALPMMKKMIGDFYEDEIDKTQTSFLFEKDLSVKEDSTHQLNFLFISLVSGLPIYIHRFTPRIELEPRYKIIAALNVLEKFFPQRINEHSHIKLKEVKDVLFRIKRDNFTIILLSKNYHQEIDNKLGQLANFVENIIKDIPKTQYSDRDTIKQLKKILDNKINTLF